ncbi:hypothetical protein Q2T83_05595 [Fervidibacter sacchari]|uniref:G8 domain-containing protein n=1 Tax=Candidatus Fervidibacter sacchari TaxID=1448929 RepID=A0ABT2ELY7_9BACT|nr:hypothetical protein [Candidatus Fervidibacter sacchari]MCS3918968.1 hypothetical protein [Candidatus Fervidibacter sacchari]WKU17295.1 hypothetical protein Q2T83_05595 [Candidatus Fervidibacter sacchari]
MFIGLSVGRLKGVNQHRQVEWGRRGRLSYLTIALLFSITMILSVSQSQTSTTRWINSAGGDWHNSSNWDNGVPDANKQAVIDLPGTYTVRINSPATAAGLVLGNDDPSDTGTKTLTVSSTLTLNGNGVIKPRSVMVLTGTLTGSGRMQVEGLMEWRLYGRMEGQGETVVVSGGQMKVGTSGYYVTLRRDGWFWDRTVCFKTRELLRSKTALTFPVGQFNSPDHCKHRDFPEGFRERDSEPKC